MHVALLFNIFQLPSEIDWPKCTRVALELGYFLEVVPNRSSYSKMQKLKNMALLVGNVCRIAKDKIMWSLCLVLILYWLE